MIQAISSNTIQRQTATLAAALKPRFGLSADYPQSLFGEEPRVRTGFFRSLFNWVTNLLVRLMPDTVTQPDKYDPRIKHLKLDVDG